MNPRKQRPSQPTTSRSLVVETFQTPPRKKLALGLLIGPTVFLIIAILGYVIVNLITHSVAPSTPTNLSTEPSPLHTIANIILFLIGTVSIVAWLPGIIIGVVLLAKKK